MAKVNQFEGKYIRNNRNYAFNRPAGERNNKPSLTVPDQSMSIREILNKSIRNGIQPLEGDRVPLYLGEISVPDVRTLDYVERAEMLEELEDQKSEAEKAIADLKKKQIEEDKLREDAAYEAKFLEKYKDRLKKD